MEHYDRRKKVPPEATVVVRETSCPPVLHLGLPCTIDSLSAKSNTHSRSGNQGPGHVPHVGPQSGSGVQPMLLVKTPEAKQSSSGKFTQTTTWGSRLAL